MLKKNKNIIICSLLIVSTFLIAYMLFNKGSVGGIITDSENSSLILTEVKVTLDSKKTLTNNNITGAFTFGGVKPGNHMITFSRAGYKTYTENINIERGKELNLQVQLNINKITENNTFKLAYTVSNNNILRIKGINNSSSDSLIQVGERPYNVEYIKSKNKIYTQSISDGIISVIDSESKVKIKDINFEQKYQIKEIKKSLSGDKLYAYAIEPHKIFIIDTSSDSLISSIDVKPLTSYFNIDSNTGKIYCLSTTDIDIFSSDGILISSYKFDKPDFYSKIVVKNNKAFIINSTQKFFIVVDLISNSESKIEIDKSVKDILLDDKSLYMLSNDSIEIYEISNISNKKSVLTKNTDNEVFVLSADGNKIYISSQKAPNIVIFDINNQSLMDKDIYAEADIRDMAEL